MKKTEILRKIFAASLVALGAFFALPNPAFSAVPEAKTAEKIVLETVVPVPLFNNGWWMERHKMLSARASEAGEKAKIVFLGDSITHMWDDAGKGKEVFEKTFSPLGAITLGISSDRTQNVLWRLENGAFPENLKPKLVVLMIGTNNWQNSPEETAAGIKAILEKIEEKSPKTKILLLAIFPRADKNFAEKTAKNNAVNKIIKGFADNRRVFFMDIGKVFLEKDGSISKEIF